MYYRFPFDFGELLEGQGIPPCSEAESIAQHIQLLITTKFGENRYDAEYGNEIWELEFDNGLSTGIWENRFVQSVTNAVVAYEQRIEKVKVIIHSELVEKTWPMKKYTEIKNKVTILLYADLVSSGEPFSFKTVLFLSPMSID
jgi:phage baseplate assembly protein W